MTKSNFLKEKLKLLRENPRMLIYWLYKSTNLFKKNALNNGERYDPNILKIFNISDPDQAERYYFAANEIGRDDKVLDIACGTGYGTLILAGKCRQATGVDASKKAIDFANKKYKKKSNISFVQIELFSFNEPADIVVSFETIEHVNKSIEDTVLKLLSLARKKLILSVPYKEPIGHNRHHAHFNIRENTFDFLTNLPDVKFLYQAKSGEISEKIGVDTVTMIMVVNKNNGKILDFRL